LIEIVIEWIRRVLPTVSPGYLKDLIPEEAPEEGEKWEDIMKDIERVIMPGVTHWHSPQFHAYYPTANSYPAIVADMLSGAIACIGFTWIASPACTELEVVMMDWLGKLLDLPSKFLATGSNGKGGGVIQVFKWNLYWKFGYFKLPLYRELQVKRLL
jgi:aromatic-L-amino-acid decarboxylase